MRSAVIVNLFLALGGALLCAGVTLLVSEHVIDLEGSRAWALLGAAIGAIGAPIFATPLVMSMSRSLASFEADLRASVEVEGAEPIRTTGLLATSRRAVDELRATLVDRAQALTTKVREGEIRQHLGEAEREHLETVLNSLHDAVIVTDAFNELKLANEAAASLLGFDAGDSLHQSIDSVIGDDELRKMIRDESATASVGHRKRTDHQFPQFAHGGAEADAPTACYDVTLACLPDAKKGAGGVVTILRDVTQEREISQVKSDFVSKVSHELRTPLSSINAYLELLVDGEAQDEDARQEFYSIIRSEADRLSRLIDNMLNISRIEAGIVKIDRTEVDFKKATEKAVGVIVPQAALKEIAVTVNATPLACTAMADADMVQQVLLNLLSNAVKYTPEGGRVIVTVDNDDHEGAVLVTVADTGLGIPPDALPKVFDKFYRIENYKRVAKGTGLGLALVKHIVETVHHGVVTVTSELGMGSKFTFTIPYEYEGA